MSSLKQIHANRRNSALSTGPRTEEGKRRTRYNGLKHGIRSEVEFLPCENPQRFHLRQNNWLNELQPRSETECELVGRIVRAEHMVERVERALDAQVATYLAEVNDREDDEIDGLLRYLFWDSRGPHPMYGLGNAAYGGPQTSWSGKIDDPIEPSRVVRRLESTAKGCAALIGVWRALQGRIEQDLMWQAHDRLKAVRMLGRQPVDAAEDERVALIYVAAFAVSPAGRKGAYQDLKADIADEFRANLVQERGGRDRGAPLGCAKWPEGGPSPFLYDGRVSGSMAGGGWGCGLSRDGRTMNLLTRVGCGGLLFVLGVAAAPGARAQTVWVEGEQPARSTMNRHPGWYDQVKKDQLSGGDWISNFSEEKEGEAEYAFDVPKAGRYAFWIRANPIQAKLDYAIDKAPGKPIDMNTDVLDSVNLAADGKPDLRFLGWKTRRRVSRSSGGGTRCDSGSIAGLSIMGRSTRLCSRRSRSCRAGRPKPGQGGRLASASGTWPFLPERDEFRADALLDLRGLNEKAAGQSGFVRLATDGESFVLGDGTPARFWGVTTYVQRDRSIEDLAHHARFLAKRGVNMVRLHGHMDPKEKNARITDVDEKAIDEAWKLVAAMKKEGIYVTISPYWSAEREECAFAVGR